MECITNLNDKFKQLRLQLRHSVAAQYFIVIYLDHSWFRSSIAISVYSNCRSRRITLYSVHIDI